MKHPYYILLISLSLSLGYAQEDQKLYEIINAVSSEHLKKDVVKLVGFGTRHTLSDTLSDSRGIGAARRWIKSEFDKISENCNNCLEVFYQKNYFTPPRRKQDCKTRMDQQCACYTARYYPSQSLHHHEWRYRF